MATYFRLKGRMPGGRVAAMFIESDGHFRETKIGKTLTGIKVTRDGERLDPLNIVMAQPEDVISLKPYVIDLKYGWLVPAGTESEVSAS